MKRARLNKKFINSTFHWILLVLLVFLQSICVFALSDSNLSNNIFNKSINIIETRELKLTFVPIDIDDDSDFRLNAVKVGNFTQKTYPIADKKVLADGCVGTNYGL